MKNPKCPSIQETRGIDVRSDTSSKDRDQSEIRVSASGTMLIRNLVKRSRYRMRETKRHMKRMARERRGTRDRTSKKRIRKTLKSGGGTD